MIMGKPGSNGTKRNSQPAAGISSQVIGNDKLGGKDSKSICSFVVGLVTQRAIQKNDSCFEIQKTISLVFNMLILRKYLFFFNLNKANIVGFCTATVLS